MDRSPRWVYVHEAHVVGIGMPYVSRGYQDIDGWQVVVLPDWMSIAFLNRLTPEATGGDYPIHYVTIVTSEDKLIMGEAVKTFERIDSSFMNSPFHPPSAEDHMMHTRILLDGVLIWGLEEYPGERQIVIPRVHIPKKLREGIPALKGGTNDNYSRNKS